MPESKGAVVKASVISSIEKADASTQLDPKEERFASEWVEPDVDLRGLGEMVDNSAILPQCIRAYKNNIAGYGIGIKYINDDQEDTPEAQAEWEMLQNIVNLFTIEQDTKEIFEDIIEARETFGISTVPLRRLRLRLQRSKYFSRRELLWHGQSITDC